MSQYNSSQWHRTDIETQICHSHEHKVHYRRGPPNGLQSKNELTQTKVNHMNNYYAITRNMQSKK